MSKIDPSAHYLKTHEWTRPVADGSNEWLAGISDHAQEALSDVVYVELPRVGSVFQAGAAYGVVESVKAASDVYIPIGGTITAANQALESDPGVINTDPYNNGWLIRFLPHQPLDLQALLDATAYEALLKLEEN